MKSNSTLIKKLFENLWPINRSITGKGFLLSLKIIKKNIIVVTIYILSIIPPTNNKFESKAQRVMCVPQGLA